MDYYKKIMELGKEEIEKFNRVQDDLTKIEKVHDEFLNASSEQEIEENEWQFWIDIEEKEKELTKIATKVDVMAEISSKVFDISYDKYSHDIHGQVYETNFLISKEDETSLENSKVYYLSHPCTTHGDIQMNKESENEIYEKIKIKNPDAKMIRPLTIIPEGEDWEKAMTRCYQLLASCDGVIMSGSWEMSKGCCGELEKAIHSKMDILEYRHTLKELTPERKENYLKTAEEQTEQNFNSIDGIINNKPQDEGLSKSIIDQIKKSKEAIIENKKETKHGLKEKDLER